MLILLLFLSFVASQSFPVCNQDSSWWIRLNNRFGQSPCQVTQEIRSNCGITTPLSLEPNSTDVNKPFALEFCICSQGVYDMYAACSACQSLTPQGNDVDVFPNFTIWSRACSSGSGQPDNFTDVLPSWVGLFNFTDHPFNTTEVITGLAPTASPVAATQTSQLASATDANTTSSLQANKASKTGPIAGGIIGVITFLALLGILWVLFKRRQKRARTAPSSEFTRYLQQPILYRPPTRDVSTDGQDGPQSPFIGESEALPAFTPGHYTGPVFEKDGYTADPNSAARVHPSTMLPSSSDVL